MIAPVEANLGEGSGEKPPERVRHTRRNDKVVRGVALQYRPHGLDIIRNPTPVAIHGQITERGPLAGRLRLRGAAMVVLRGAERVGRSGDSWFNGMHGHAAVARTKPLRGTPP